MNTITKVEFMSLPTVRSIYRHYKAPLNILNLGFYICKSLFIFVCCGLLKTHDEYICKGGNYENTQPPVVR